MPKDIIWKYIGLKEHITAIHEKMKNFNFDIRFAKGYSLKVLIQNVHEKIKIGKNFAKGFNLKLIYKMFMK